MYSFVLSTSAQKQLKTLPYLVQELIISCFDEISEDPLLGKELTKELTGTRSFKVGNYRIVYKVNIQKKVITVLRIGQRAKVYK